MASFLHYTSPARGHLYPVVPVLAELRSRGHRVAVRTLESEVSMLSDMGLEAKPIAPEIEGINHDDWKAKSPFAANRRVLDVFAKRAKHEIPDLRNAISEEFPDVLLIDISTEGAAAVAEASGIPWAHYTPYFVPLSSDHAPPFGIGLRPGDGPLQKARDALVRKLLLDPLLGSNMTEVNAVRESVGAPALSDLSEQWRRAPLHLYLTAEPFEYPRPDWPESFRLVGPGVWEPPQEPPEWLPDIDGPVVLVSTSSEFQDDQKLIQTAFDALADEAFTVVATVPAGDPAQFDAPANARVLSFAPHAPILERAACVICHGGMGITQKALSAGVPVCVVPFGRDQLEVAGHVVANDAGTRLFPQLLSARRLRRAVHGALERREGAARIATAFASAGGPPAAADELESLVS